MTCRTSSLNWLDVLYNSVRKTPGGVAEPQWIAAGSLEEVAQLLEAVAGLNKDFFARRLRRMVAAIREAVSLPASPTSSSS